MPIEGVMALSKNQFRQKNSGVMLFIHYARMGVFQETKRHFTAFSCPNSYAKT
jgi:hypothetical protein